MNIHYELLIITPTPDSTSAKQAILQKFVDLATKSGVNITKNELWEERKLAYEIKKYKNGLYLVFEFDSEPEALKKMESEFQLMPEVIRHLVVKKKVRSAEDIAEQKRIREKIQERKVREAHVAAAAEQKKTTDKKEEVKKDPKTEKLRLEELDDKLDKLLKEDI